MKMNMSSYGNTDCTSGVSIIGNRVWINGEEIPPCPSKKRNSTVVTKDDRVFINGWEWKNGKWKKTLRAFFECYGWW